MIGQDGAAELGTAGGFVAYHVGPGAAEAGGTHCLVGVNHDMMLRGLHDGVVVVVDHELAVVVLPFWEDVAHIAALHGIVTVAVHEIVRIFHVTLVIDCRRGSFVMHYKLHTKAVRIGVEPRKVEVGIRGNKVENVEFLAAEPVFPALVPALYKKGVKTVGRGEIEVTLHVLRGGAVAAVRSGLGIVGFAEAYCRKVVGVAPVGFAGDHLPPHAHVFHGMNPGGGVGNGTGLVQIQDKPGSQHITGIVHGHHRAPRALARSLHAALPALGIRGKPGGEGAGARVVVKAGRRIVQHRGLVNVDVEAVVGTHLQRGLHSGG